MKKISAILYGWLVGNDASFEERIEFAKSVSKNAPEELTDVVYMGNYDHVPFEVVYKRAGVMRSTIGSQSGPMGAGTASNFASHIHMWNYAANSDIAVAILEHDTRLMAPLTHMYVPDDIILCLGPRVPTVDHYTYPKGSVGSVIDVQHHAGSHAYAISPVTARKLLKVVREVGIFDSIDQMIFMNNKKVTMKTYYPDLQMQAVDPPPVIAVWADNEGKQKESSIGRSAPGANIQPNYNYYLTPGFEKGLQLIGKTND